MKYMTVAQAVKSGIAKSKVRMSEVQMGLTYGNMKLVDTAKSRFIIWSIPAVSTCPYKTVECTKACYALKAERIYPTVKNRRALNLEASKMDTFVNDMIEQIEYELERNPKNILFRIHESGDFYDLEYLYKFIDIANHFKGNNRIKFMAYTKSIPLVKRAFDFYGNDGVNIKFKSSVWSDTKPALVEMSKDLGLTVFTALSKTQFKEKDYSKYFKCPSSASIDEMGCGECAEKTGGCYFSNVNIAIEIH